LTAVIANKRTAIKNTLEVKAVIVSVFFDIIFIISDILFS